MVRNMVLAVALTATTATVALGGGFLCMLAGDQFSLSDQQVHDLRSQGPRGLEQALATWDRLAEVISDIDAVMVEQVDPDVHLTEARELAESHAAALRPQIDAIAGQRDATVSRLYWFTDLNEAKQAAAEAGKPILSLRMLGKLTDELSCANSRYFRTALYANTEVSDFLRDHFVLHWQSVRPVPRVTIDFGDGRKLERTITGNSAHYVLDAAGRPFDALPGLYGPKSFRQWLERSDNLVHACATASGDEARQEVLAQYHGHRLQVIEGAFRDDLDCTSPDLLPVAMERTAVSAKAHGKPTAKEAAFRAVTKTAEVAPIVEELLPAEGVLDRQDDAFWLRIAERHADDAHLDAASVAIIRRENPDARAAGHAAYSKSRVEDPIARLVLSFEAAIALDSVKNEYMLHRKIHEWYASREAPEDLDALNERVYAELFLTPSSDPWLGLAPADAYTGLSEGGLSATP